MSEMLSELSERKKLILKAIIDSHIHNGEPVGSKYLSENKQIACSSATIRNEMAELEEAGYLEQPHSSAGRVPSEKGYRFYVDELMQQYSMTQEQAAERVGKSRSAVANVMRLLDLDPAVQKLVENGLLSAGHARALVPLSPSQQVQAANSIINSGLSVRQAELLAKRLSAEQKPERKKIADEVDYTAEAQKELSSQLGRGVKIVNGRKKGRIELEYYGMEDLNDLLEALALLKVRKAQKGPKE